MKYDLVTYCSKLTASRRRAAVVRILHELAEIIQINGSSPKPRRPRKHRLLMTGAGKNVAFNN
jgi:hypothetical protein